MGCCSGDNERDRDNELSQNRPTTYDTNFNGPLSKRSCTDVICLLIFIAFLACWGKVGHYAIKNGDIDRLIVPTDSQGLKCGVDAEVISKPYIVFFELQTCISPLVAINGCPTPQVCVEKCPESFFLFHQDICNSGNLDTIKSQLVCNRNVNITTIQSCAQITELIKQESCASWYLPSRSLSKRCLPMMVDQTDIQRILSEFHLKMEDFVKAVDNIEILSNINEVGQKIIEDIATSKWRILVALIVAMVCSLILITMMRWFAAPLLWLSIIGVLAMLGSATYYSVTKFIELRDHPINDVGGHNLASLVNEYLAKKETWFVLSIVSGVVLLIILLILIFLRKRITIAIALVKEGSKAVSSTLTTVFFPIFPWVVEMLLIAFAVIVAFYLASVGTQVYTVVGLDDTCVCTGPAANYKNGTVCNPQTFANYCHTGYSNPCAEAACHFRKIENPYFIRYFHAWNIFGFFWAVFFISAFGEMVLAATFATWYWTFHKSDVPFFTLTVGLRRTIRYHLGTLAFGSLIVAICRMIRLGLEYLDHKLKKYDNAFVRAIMCCLKLFFWCLEKFLKFINKNAYVMCAIHGKNFCSSAKDAFNLLLRNVLRAFALDQVTDFLLFLSKLLISLGMGVATYFYLESGSNTHKFHYSLVPAGIVMIGTYLIARVFFGVYSMAVDTLFLCFLEDCERNDGSPEKPYFMSPDLMKILGKKNKVPRGEYQ